MRILRIALRLVLVLVLVAGAVGLWKREQVARLLAVNSLFAPDRIVANFSAMDSMFLSRAMDGGSATPLAQGQTVTLPEGFDAWAEARAVTGWVVLKDGAVVSEGYRLGTAPEDLRISWSVAKSALSLLYGILLAEGAVPPLDTPVARAVPQLVGTAYDGATLRDVITMSSGIAFDEDYLDFWSDINKMGRVLALGQRMDDFAASQRTRAHPPGTVWQYVSIDTHVLGMAIRQATGRAIPDLLSERLLRPIGLERDPYYLTDGAGVAFVLGGLNLTTRDYARLGLLVAQGGRWGDRQVVPAAWIEESTRPQAPDGAAYGYQWLIPENPEPGEVLARGIYGQFVYIHPGRGVVVAVNAADRGFRQPGVMDANIAMFRQIASRF